MCICPAVNETAGLEHEASHGRRILSSVKDFWSNGFVMFQSLVTILWLLVMWDYVRGIEKEKARKSQFGSIQHQSIRLNAACGNACDSLLRAHPPTNNARASRWEMVGNGNGQAPWWMWSIMAPLCATYCIYLKHLENLIVALVLRDSEI